jgi:hypothetical protein
VQRGFPASDRWVFEYQVLTSFEPTQIDLTRNIAGFAADAIAHFDLRFSHVFGGDRLTLPNRNRVVTRFSRCAQIGESDRLFDVKF